MCDTCGCGQPDEAVTIRKPGEDRTFSSHMDMTMSIHMIIHHDARS